MKGKVRNRILLILFGGVLGLILICVISEIRYFLGHGTIFAFRGLEATEIVSLSPPKSIDDYFTTVRSDTTGGLSRLSLELSKGCCSNWVAAVEYNSTNSDPLSVSLSMNNRISEETYLLPNRSHQIRMFSDTISGESSQLKFISSQSESKSMLAVYNSELPADPNGPSRLFRSEIFRGKSSRIRILAIGGSTTFGFNLPAHSTWPHLLQCYLEMRYPGRFEVINLGRIGGSLSEFIADFQNGSVDYVPRLDLIDGDPDLRSIRRVSLGWRDLGADIIIAAPIINDTAPDLMAMIGRSRESPLKAGGLALLELPLLNLTSFSYYARSYLRQNMSAPLLDSSLDIKPFVNEVERSFENRLRSFIKLWKVPVILISFPILYRESDSFREVEYAENYWSLPATNSAAWDQAYLPQLISLEREVFSRAGVPHYSISTGIEEMPFKSRIRLFSDSVHLNGSGMSIVAGDLVAQISAELEKRFQGIPQ